MSYHLSTAKLHFYRQCPQAYYFRYECHLRPTAFAGGPAEMGTALHQALAKIYQDWHYQDPVPGVDWVDHCWQQHTTDLTPSQIFEGQAILRRYYRTFIGNRSVLNRPVATEGKVQGHLSINNLEFSLSGRYDRLDWLSDGLELIDYKSSKAVKEMSPDQINLQLGLYYLALEQRYHQRLKRLSIIYLRSGQVVSFDATPFHKEQIEASVCNLAMRLRAEKTWEPQMGDHCHRCPYLSYCPAHQPQPQPIPQTSQRFQGLQLALL